MQFIFGIAFGMAAYQFMLKVFRWDINVSEPTAWVLGILGIVFYNFLETILTKIQSQKSSTTKLSVKNKELVLENKILKEEIDKIKNNKEIDFFKK